MQTYKFIKSIYDYLNEQREVFTSLYHGTSLNAAIDIQNNGIDITKSEGGYFGYGFYTTPDYNLARSNYADFSDEEDDSGVILEFELLPSANILDLRVAEDFEIWKKYAKKIHDRNLYKELIKNGIDGLYDDSFEGVVVYNSRVLIFKNIIN